jgi:hypothetical protein
MRTTGNRYLALLTVLLITSNVCAQTKTFVTRPSVSHVRVMSWNVGANSIFADPGNNRTADAARVEAFRRVVKNIAPDVACFQEIFAPRVAADVAAIFDEALPLGNGGKWYSHGVGDAVIVSRFPLSMQGGTLEDHGGGVPRPHATALVDVPKTISNSRLWTLCTHFQSRGEAKDIAARQNHADAIAALLRDLRTPGGQVDLAAKTPFVLVGDWNAYVVPPATHIDTLIAGKISNEEKYGKGVAPDWDSSPLRDAAPVHNAKPPATYTFGDGSGKPFPNAAIDRILFTGSALELLGGFVLNTKTLTETELSTTGFAADDVLRNGKFDHLPVVADLGPKKR